MRTVTRRVTLVVAFLGALVVPATASADEMLCDDNSATFEVAAFIAEGRTQVDVAVGDSTAYNDVLLTATDSTGAVVASRKINLSDTEIYDADEYDDEEGGYKLYALKGLPKTGPLVITATGADDYYVCDDLTFEVPRKKGSFRFKWVEVSAGYALDPTNVFGITNYTVTTDGSCQTLPVGVRGTVTIAGSGVAGDGARTIRFKDLCELVPGHSRIRRSKTAGAVITGSNGLRISPTYTEAGAQSYVLTMRAGGKTITSRRKANFRPAYKIWEGSDEFFNYCIRNLFDVDIVMQNGQRYCTKPASRSF